MLVGLWFTSDVLLYWKKDLLSKWSHLLFHHYCSSATTTVLMVLRKTKHFEVLLAESTDKAVKLQCMINKVQQLRRYGHIRTEHSRFLACINLENKRFLITHHRFIPNNNCLQPCLRHKAMLAWCVRLSVTRRYSTKTAKHWITQRSAYDIRPWTVFWCQRSRQNSNRGAKRGGVGYSRRFSTNISETVQDKQAHSLPMNTHPSSSRLYYSVD